MSTLTRESEVASGRITSTAVAIVLTLYMAVVFGLGLYLFSLLASEMRGALGFGTRTIGMVTAAAQISFLVAAIVCPVITRIFGEGRVIVAAVVTSGFLLAALSTISTTSMMTVLIAALGSCAAFMVIPTVGVISRTVALQYRSRVNGLVSSGTAYGQLTAGTITPWLVPGDGWRSVWLVLGIASIGVAIVGAVALKLFAAETFSSTTPSSQTSKEEAITSSALFTRTTLISTYWVRSPVFETGAL